MEEELRLNDISNELLILNKMTIDRLFQLDNCVECIALYVFYYKTAKWQKTNTIKANDVYVQKCLKWGKSKVTKIKEILKENGLIKIIQRRENGKISGWYVEISYIVTQRKIEDIQIKVEESKKSPEQEVVATRSGVQDTNALKEKIKCLEREIEMLKNKNTIVDVDIPYKEIIEYLNNRTGTNYRHTTNKTRDLIKARFNEGFTLDDFKEVIDKKCVEWYGTDMQKYLRPETLFGTKFESYLNQQAKERKLTTKDLTIDISDF